MRTSTILLSAALPTLLAIACSSGSSAPAGNPGESADPGASSGGSGSSGAGGGSSGAASADAGAPAVDGGASSSSGSSGARGASDGGDASVPNACPTTLDYAHCTEANLVDFAATDATINLVTGDYSAGIPSTFDPPCIKIKANQNVTWSGSLKVHPLRPAPCNPAGDTIPSVSAGTSTTLRMTTPGIYGYQCDVHAGTGMKGVIVVY